LKLFETTFDTLKDETSATAARLRAAYLLDAATEERAIKAKSETPPQLFGLILDGLDEVQAYFYKYSFPDLFGDIRPERIQRCGAVIERYYQFYDRILSKYLAALKEDELLIVYSPYGVEPLPFWKRLVEWLLGNAEISAYHERGPDGAIFFYGNKGVVRGRNVEPVRVADIAPTLLYYAGLPVGKYMDGFVRTAVFTAEFKNENPIQTIVSYEDVIIQKRK
jgi:predicted AlkP superfamily phosphohydrolase/phosphomutase